MGIGEWTAWVLVLLLALYGCAGLIRRICLWMNHCPKTVKCYTVAFPPDGASLEPLFRFLQAQTAWGEDGRCPAVLVLPDLTTEEKTIAERLCRENPAVIPIEIRELERLCKL